MPRLLFLPAMLALLLAGPAEARPRSGVSASSTVTSIGTSYSTSKLITCNGTTDNVAKAEAFPGGRIGWVRLELSSISSATQVTWFLAEDASLDEPISLEKTSTILTGVTTATDGAVVQSFENLPVIPQVAGTIYIAAKGNAGTFSAHCVLYWEEQ